MWTGRQVLLGQGPLLQASEQGCLGAGATPVARLPTAAWQEANAELRSSNSQLTRCPPAHALPPSLLPGDRARSALSDMCHGIGIIGSSCPARLLHAALPCPAWLPCATLQQQLPPPLLLPCAPRHPATPPGPVACSGRLISFFQPLPSVRAANCAAFSVKCWSSKDSSRAGGWMADKREKCGGAEEQQGTSKTFALECVKQLRKVLVSGGLPPSWCSTPAGQRRREGTPLACLSHGKRGGA